MNRTLPLVAVATFVAALSSAAPPPGPPWPQWGLNAQHNLFAGTIKAQPMNTIYANIVYDPLVPTEMADNQGDLLAHYQVPLVDGNDVYMEAKGGTYTISNYGTQIWFENKFSWVDGQLAQQWSFQSDWTAPGSANDFWEPVFHAALANGYVYAPGAGGSIFKLNRANGSVVSRINPFKTINANTFTVSPLTVDRSGNIFYNVVKVQNAVPFYQNDAVDSWLVKVGPDDSVQTVSYTTLLAGKAPAATDLCYATFSTSQLPWPPSPTAIPPQITCGLQRVALNIAPAIAPDGTVYSITRAQFDSRYAYIVAINPNLTLKWATSLRGPDTGADGTYFSGGYFVDGCGVPVSAGGSLPPNGYPNGCRAGALYGVDPAVNRLGGGRVLDDSSATPTIAPDGSVIYGAYTRYNWAQGHLMRFDGTTGALLASYGFGWDTTAAIYPHDGTYSIITKNNHYNGLGSYCNDDSICPPERNTLSQWGTAQPSLEAYYVSQFDPNLAIEWSYQNTNTLSCQRNADGSVSCVSDHPNGFEWCVNAPVIDQTGTVYANSEDGNIYAIRQGGSLLANFFQQLALGAAYTPTSFGGDGKIYSQNAGHLFVVGK